MASGAFAPLRGAMVAVIAIALTAAAVIAYVDGAPPVLTLALLAAGVVIAPLFRWRAHRRRLP